MDVERIRKEMGLMEKILSYVPGYRGYKEKELRRETDILVRRKVSSLLAEARADLNSPLSPSEARQLANDSEARFLFETVRAMLDKAVQRIDKAVAGYAGLFDSIKVREDRLDAVLRHDLALIEKAESVKQLVAEIKGGEADWKNKAGRLKSVLMEFDRLVDERTALLKGLSEVV
ncbi:MAG: hypothetical protein QXO30_07145 [Candidatus Caldarchaeum sp.]